MTQPKHPWVQLAVGRRGSGKTHSAIAECQRWRAAYGERTHRMQALVIDPVATDPPQPHHLAAHADVVASSPDDLAHALDTLPIGLVVVDEAETWLSQGDANRRPIGPLVDILRRGRHRGVSIYLCSQRPQLLAYDVWSLADRIVICQLTGKRDLDRVCELEGVAEHRHAIASSNRPGPVVTWTPAGIVRHP